MNHKEIYKHYQIEIIEDEDWNVYSYLITYTSRAKVKEVDKWGFMTSDEALDAARYWCDSNNVINALKI